MKGLLYKEWLAARPYLVATVVLGLVGIVSDLASRTVLSGLAASLTDDAEAWLLITGALAFAVGHTQAAPEMTRGHIELLDGLPVGRFQVFAAKLGVGLATLGLLLAVTLSTQVLYAELAYGAQSRSTVLDLARAHAAGLLGFYGTGLLYSWLGGFGWALLGLGVTFTFVLAETSATLRPLSMMHGFGAVRFEANAPVVVTWPLTFWFVWGAVHAGLSGLVFLGPGDLLVRGGSRAVPIVRLLALGGLSAQLVLIAVVDVVRLASRGGLGLQSAEIVEAGPFRLLVPETATTAAARLAPRMAEIDTRVRAVLGDPPPLRLDVELGPSGRYHAGLYTGGKIRMAADDDITHTFAHELTHAYAHALAKDGLHRHMNALRAFNEGLAMWVAERVEGRIPQSAAFRQWAGAIYAMDHHHLDGLFDDGRRAVRFDTFEAYPLGLVFTEALVEVRGPEVIACLLSQVSLLPDASIEGVAVWARLLDGCRVDATALADAYARQLAAHRARYPSEVPPRLSGRPTLAGGAPVIEVGAVVDDSDRSFWCRFRSRKGAKPKDLADVRVRGGRCAVRAVDHTTRTVSFQIGKRLSRGWTAYGPWIERKVPE